MNETLISDISEKSKKSVPAGILSVDKWMQTYNEKFAENILKECYTALNPMLRDMISRGQGVDAIRKHFGVDHD